MGEIKNLHVIPLSLFILLPVTFLITYSLSVFWDHVSPTFPYISETGTLSPESCIFAQLLNIAAALLGFCVYIRHKQVSMFSKLRPNSAVSRIANRLATTFGILSCIGLDILANFQETRSVGVHMIGAMTCFAATNVYFCMQTVFSCNMCPYINSLGMIYLRGTLSFLSICLTTTTVLPGSVAMTQFNGTNYQKWAPADGGWELHLVSTISEWLLAMAFCAFILTFVQEFRKIYFHSPVIEFEIQDVHIDLNNSAREKNSNNGEILEHQIINI